MQSVADRIAELRRTKKRPAQSIANWAARERRRGQHWLADSIEQQAGIVPKKEPAVALAKVETKLVGVSVDRRTVFAQPRYWWLDD